eukprot:CAMPEP_0201111956 /NCGR_PEP_ID=MMETSP0812-20130820/76939_1 /ASSEMBLY_ACC=CAM_ASM_000668 /TAXON_ID=98059 /ORGANISM="Dinobryon sp., Strain UTEXLB2267" /LENGTH=367 /DNA_ID=CAMNT_0047375173 /DNA_START=49 /DNA_END=1152 /DNA_ORIENTATION=-
MFKPLLSKLMARENLSSEEVESAVDFILNSTGSDVSESICVGAFLVLLRAKTESPVEIAAMVRAMKKKSLKVTVHSKDNGQIQEKLLDIVGTGGDGADTFNISTSACLLAAACGCSVAKCGNRASSSNCGSADVLEALGVPLQMNGIQVAACIQQCGLGFLFAPVFHPAAKVVAPIRKALGVRTAFNLLGPLLNSAEAERVVIGVFEEPLLELIAGALQEIGLVQHALVVTGCGLDEVSPLGPSQVVELRRAAPGAGEPRYLVSRYSFDPLSVGIPRCQLSQLRGGVDARSNADMLREVLRGGCEQDARRDAVVLNAGLGNYVFGLAGTLEEGVQLARRVLETGAALERLDKWLDTAQKLVVDPEGC